MMGGQGRRPPPADLAQMAATMTITELWRHYRCTDRTVVRWLREAGLQAKTFKAEPRLPTPADFAERAPTTYMMALARHYGVSQQTVMRWAERLGVKLAPYVKPRKEKPEKPAQQRFQPFIWKGQRPSRVPPRDTTIIGSAAEHLRRFTPVYRCQAKGSADPTGEFFRYGNTVLTPDELLMRAKRHGWEASA